VTKGSVCGGWVVNLYQNAGYALRNRRALSECKSGPGLAECLFLHESSWDALVDATALDSEDEAGALRWK